MFALEWCEFCWSVRRLFEQLDMPCRVLSLDAVEFQDDDRGGRIRGVLRGLTGSPTIPQVFIGGRHMGGCTDVFDACRSGVLQRDWLETWVSHDRAGLPGSLQLPARPGCIRAPERKQIPYNLITHIKR
jgi:cysteine synthase